MSVCRCSKSSDLSSRSIISGYNILLSQNVFWTLDSAALLMISPQGYPDSDRYVNNVSNVTTIAIILILLYAC